MSKAGVNITPTKQDSNLFKKENRTSNSGNSSSKDDRRTSGGFSNSSQSGQGNSQGRGGGQNSSSSNQNNQHDRDRSGNRTENRQFDSKNAPEHDKSTEKEDKNAGDAAAGAVAPGEKKFTGRCRLFVGNLTPDVTENEFKKMFEPFGEISEVYVNTSRGFGFIRLDYRHNAEAAKAALDGHQRKGRILRVRFATHGAALKVKNLHPYVSNELLEQSFSQFGELERCVVIVDDRGKPTGEGIVEFVRKPGANSALRRINDGVFLMGVDPKPVAVEPLEQKDEEDGMPEKFLTRTDQYKKERDKEPRFAPPGTFEYEFGMRWKALEDLERQRIEQIKKDTEEARLKLEDEMQNALYEYQAEQIRQDLLRQQEELRRLEELRNQDRMRRQQEMEMRRQQEERERAQQDDRRRTDMMLSMRQQELARGRGPIDPPGMRSREELMMADRYADRLSERMSDRMADRMSDRMSDRLGDRMGPGQSGFMWDDKQRGETGMRGDGGRGRDMRGSGAPPLQPPPVPPSAMSAMERGGPAGASSSGQNSKSSPKPLMAASGFGSLGGQSGSGPGANSSTSGDNSNQMDDDCTTEVKESQFLENDNILSTEVTEKLHVATSTEDLENSCDENSSDLFSQDLVTSNISQPDDNQSKLGDSNMDFVETMDTITEGRKDLCSIDRDSSSKCIFNTGNNNCLSQNDPESFPLSKTHSNTRDHNLRCHSEERYCSSDNIYTFKSERAKSVECCDKDITNVCSTSWYTDHTDKDPEFTSSQVNCLLGKNNDSLSSLQMHDELSLCCAIPNNRTDVSKGKPVLQRHLSADNVADEMPLFNKSKAMLQRYLSADNVKSDNSDHCVDGAVDYLSAEELSQKCPLGIHSEKSYQFSDDGPVQEDIYRSSDSSSQYTLSSTQSECSKIGAKYINRLHEKTTNPFTAAKEMKETDNLNYVNSESESGYKQVEEYSSTDFKHSVNNCSQSSYKQINKTHTASSNYKQNDLDLTSYKQSCEDDVGEMDTGTLDEEDTQRETNGPDIYQSYEENLVASHYQNASIGDGPLVAEYNTDSNISNQWNINNNAEMDQDITNSSNVSCENFPSSFSSNQNTIAEVSATSEPSTSRASLSPTPLPQAQVHSHNEDDHEGVLCTGDQSFKSAAARQSALIPFMKSSHSVPFVPNINPSLYAGAAVVQGISGPTIMSSSSVHIAHPGGATIMRHQTVSAGGGITQATVMQQQAMANGAQATAVLQQRTLTNRGQTMVLQQRTMTTGLGGMTQQTVVQQRMAAPNSVAQAVYHANAMRQRAIATQQASLIQQQAMRLAQARVMNTQMLRAQALSGAFLQQTSSRNCPSILNASLVRGGAPGSVMQQLVRQRYLGGPVMPGRGIQMVAGRPVRVKLTYTRESLPMDSNT